MSLTCLKKHDRYESGHRGKGRPEVVKGDVSAEGKGEKGNEPGWGLEEH